MTWQLWLMLAPWAGTAIASLVALYYRSRALRAETAVSDVAQVGRVADAELKAAADQRRAALDEMSRAQDAQHAEDRTRADGAATDAARAAELLRNPDGAGGGAPGALPVQGPRPAARRAVGFRLR